MIVAAHQPGYLPWLGYFDKVASADVFVIMDDLQYEAEGFQNRNRVKLQRGPAWLTVPVERGSRSDTIREKRVHVSKSPVELWRRRHWETLRVHYGRAPHFARYADELEEVYAREWHSLLELDVALLRRCLSWLAISRPIRFASELALTGRRSARIVDLCQKLGATSYLSGSGGSRAYLDTRAFAAAGIEVWWQDFVHPTYEQRYPAQGFAPNLGAIDLILNLGPEAGRLLAKARRPPIPAVVEEDPA